MNLTAEQLLLLTDACSKHKALLHVDATGLSTKRRMDEKKRIFMCVLIRATRRNPKDIGVAEMLTNDHSMPSNTNFLPRIPQMKACITELPCTTHDWKWLFICHYPGCLWSIQLLWSCSLSIHLLGFCNQSIRPPWQCHTTPSVLCSCDYQFEECHRTKHHTEMK